MTYSEAQHTYALLSKINGEESKDTMKLIRVQRWFKEKSEELDEARKKVAASPAIGLEVGPTGEVDFNSIKDKDKRIEKIIAYRDEIARKGNDEVPVDEKIYGFTEDEIVAMMKGSVIKVRDPETGKVQETPFNISDIEHVLTHLIRPDAPPKRNSKRD